MKNNRIKQFLKNAATDMDGISIVPLSIANMAVDRVSESLRDRFANDIHKLVSKWGEVDNITDTLHFDEINELQAENERLRQALDEANQRCEIAQKVIADKNSERYSSGHGMTLDEYQREAMTTCLPRLCDV